MERRYDARNVEPGAANCRFLPAQKRGLIVWVAAVHNVCNWR